MFKIVFIIAISLFCICLPAQAIDLQTLDIQIGTSIELAKKLHPTLIEFPGAQAPQMIGKDFIKTRFYIVPTKDPEALVYIFASTNNSPYRFSGAMFVMRISFEDALAGVVKDIGTPKAIEHDQAFWQDPYLLLVRIKIPSQLKLGYKTCLLVSSKELK